MLGVPMVTAGYGGYNQNAAPQRTASVRHKSIAVVAMAPFRDDTSLVALRYDETFAAEPPIPIPPPRSPLRPLARPLSIISVPTSAATGAPPPRPPPPVEQHPALRTITSPPKVKEIVKTQTPSTSSSRSYAYYDSETEGDEDPFAYERIDIVAPLQLRSRSVSSSIYSEDEARVSESYSRFSDSSLESQLESPGLSDGNTVSSGSPATPPPQFSKRFGRSFSLRSSNSTKAPPMKRLRKKALYGNNEAGNDRTPRWDQNPDLPAYYDPSLNWLRAAPGHTTIGTTTTITAGAAAVKKEHEPLSVAMVDPDNKNSGAHSRPSSNDSSILGNPPASPVISTTIPTETLLEDDFMSQLSFSIRGSLLFGGKRPRRRSKMADGDRSVEKSKQGRAFPLVPSVKKSHKEKDATIPAQEKLHEKVDTPNAPHNQTTDAQPSAAKPDALATPRAMPPSIRVISAEAAKESQKVRSLYESGESLNWEDGGGHSSPGEGLEPTAREVSADDRGEHDAPPNDQPTGHPTLVLASTPSLAPHDSTTRADYELAGGIEDWEGVDGQDVDRYGFISPQRPQSSRLTTSDATSAKFSPRKKRNVLVKKDAASRSLEIRRAPGKKLSARSLNTQTSAISAASRRSTRSAVRQATNLMPHNKDRRLVDQAGDILASPPGLIQEAEEEAIEKINAELKQKEIERSEKWRKMASVIKSGSDGQGTIFEFDPKHPKLAKRTWKGIPDRWRAAAWYSFLASSAKANEDPFVTDEQIKIDFHRLLEEASPDDGQIDLDVPRTINQHVMFRRRYRGGQRLLFRVLHSLSLYYPKTGYVQGMAPLAATFLSYYDEEACFVMLVRLWRHRGLNRIYQTGFEELMTALRDFERNWLGRTDMASKLTELCIDPTAYATRWYLTLFNLSIPFHVQLRVWDVFMLLGSSPPQVGDSEAVSSKSASNRPSLDGLEILHATSLAIMDTLRERLIDSDFENAMKMLTSWVPIKDERHFLNIVQIEYKRHQKKNAQDATLLSVPSRSRQPSRISSHSLLE